jgi:hypothetical protein
MAEKQLRSKAIDAIGSIIIAVTDSEQRDDFKASVLSVTEYLSKLIQSGLSDDDPQDTSAKDTLTQCAGFLKVEFAQFMPYLMQPILHDANLSLDFKMENADLPQTSDNMAMKVKVKGFGEQRVSLNTENLVKKTGAFALIQQVSENMGRAFAPYVEPLMPIIVAHMTFDHSRAIKKFALKSFTNFLVAAGEPANIGMMQASFHLYTENLEKALSRHDEKQAKIMVKAIPNNLRALNKNNANHRAFLSQA